jgi:uncharacterized protein involved in outer membrane biogenesis
MATSFRKMKQSVNVYAAKLMVFGVLTLLCAVAALLLVTLLAISPNLYKSHIEKLAARQGIELVLHGNLSHTIALHPAIKATNVDVVMMVGKTKYPLHVDTLQATVDIIAALTGDLALRDVSVSNLSSPMLTANGKPLPLTLHVANMMIDQSSDTLTIDKIVIQIANITVRAQIAIRSLFTSPTVIVDP